MTLTHSASPIAMAKVCASPAMVLGTARRKRELLHDITKTFAFVPDANASSAKPRREAP